MRMVEASPPAHASVAVDVSCEEPVPVTTLDRWAGDQGIEKFEDLKKLTLFVSKEGIVSYFQWMKRDFGWDSWAYYNEFIVPPVPV